MLRIRPFPAIRPRPENAARVASVPYDVVSTDEARALAAGNPESFLHVLRPEIDLPPGTSPYDDAVYARGATNLRRLLDSGALLREDHPALYLYRQVQGDRSQTGLVCCCHIDDYLEDVIKKHEKTRADKEDDRTRHTLELNANAGPVFLTYRGRRDIDEMIEADTARPPLYDFSAPDGVSHTVWTVPDAEAYVEAFRQIPCAYVADGHHRSASAARAGATRRAANADHRGDEEYNFFMTVLFAADQLTILPYNRLVKDLGGRTPADVLAALREVGDVSPTSDPGPDRPGVFDVYLDGAWHRVALDPASIDASDCIAGLDVELLHRRVLAPILDIGDPRTDARLDFVGGIRGTDELARRVDAGDAAVAIAMCATTIEQLLAVSDAGRVMPPKSTWFEPKLRSGLFVHDLG